MLCFYTVPVLDAQNNMARVSDNLISVCTSNPCEPKDLNPLCQAVFSLLLDIPADPNFTFIDYEVQPVNRKLF